MVFNMYQPTVDQDDILNSNYLRKKQGDESPIIVRSVHRSTYFEDTELQPTSEKPLRSPSSGLSKREKLMIAGIILLVILLIVFIVLFAKAGKVKRKESQPSKESIIIAAGKLNSVRT